MPMWDMRGSGLLHGNLTIAPISLVTISCFDRLSWTPNLAVMPDLAKAVRRRESVTRLGGAAAA